VPSDAFDASLTHMNDLDVLTSNSLEFNVENREFVRSVVRRIVRLDDAVEDVTQEALLTAFRHRESFRGESKYRTWLYRVAITSALGYLRRLRRSREQVLLGSELRDAIDPANTPEVAVGNHEEIELANRLVMELAPKYRDVVLMRADHSETETAEKLGISVANVKVRAHRARAQLRAALAAA
jgi:RNA polymerase sigma-70 factor (ECF subfamily)